MILKNNKIGITLYVIISFILGFTACESTGTQGKGLLSSSGRSGEMLVVCQSSAWKGALGDSLRSMFMSSLECLPQNEPYFTLSHISNDKFNAIYQKQRNFYTLISILRIQKQKLPYQKINGSPQLK